jgi:uncharacterized membrane protein
MAEQEKKKMSERAKGIIIGIIGIALWFIGDKLAYHSANANGVAPTDNLTTIGVSLVIMGLILLAVGLFMAIKKSKLATQETLEQKRKRFIKGIVVGLLVLIASVAISTFAPPDIVGFLIVGAIILVIMSIIWLVRLKKTKP